MPTCTKVTVRRRPKGKQQQALYLDFYPPIRVPETMRSTRRESLGLFVWTHPKTEIERQHNKETEMKAEAIRSVRVQALINEQFGFLDTRKKNGDFLAYFKKHAREKGDKWLMTYAHFEKFTSGRCTFGELTVDLCNRFRDYLTKASQLRRPHLALSTNSAAAYFVAFRAMLRTAYRNRMVQENVNEFLDAIPTKPTKREYLTLDEMKRLGATPCGSDVLKRASLFAFMTGLRVSDILQLDWSMRQPSPFGGQQMRFQSIKTGEWITVPLNDEIQELMGDCGDEGLVFRGLTRSLALAPLAIDDLGREPKQIMDFGNTRAPMVELLYERYDKGSWTHATSNFAFDTLSSDAFYGPMLGDRFRTMFNVINLPGDSRRT